METSLPQVEIRRLTEPAGENLAAMTFPVFAPLLNLKAQPIYPDQGDEVTIRPLILVASIRDREVGMALAALPAGELGAVRLLSLFVARGWRRLGLGAALVAAAEKEAAEDGASGIEAVYTTGKPAIPFFERILQARDWSPPIGRTLSVRLTPAAGFASDLLDPRRLRHQARGLEIVPWSEIPAEAKQRLRRSQEGKSDPWMAPLLAPWRFDQHGYDPSSVGALQQGEIVGWVITHRVSAETVRLTCSFMHPELSPYGKILPLYGAVLEQVRPRCRWCSFVTPFSYPSMISFIRRRLVPISEFVGETRESRHVFRSRGDAFS